MSTLPSSVSGVAAGVPFLALPPSGGARWGSPALVAWHLMDPPRTERAFAAALPLAGLDAWRIYLGLPLCGARLPAGGQDELMRRGYEDTVMNLQGPIAAQGAQEFPAAFTELRRQLDLGDGSLGLLGGSMGSAVAQLVLTETGPAAGLLARAAVLVSPMVQLRPAVEATGRRFGVTYPWAPASLKIAARMDFVARADELLATGQPAVRLIVGADDDHEGFLEPAQRLQKALAARYDHPDRVDLVVVPGLQHALADEPGDEPAPQTAQAVTVDEHAVSWLRQHLDDHMPSTSPAYGAAR